MWICVVMLLIGGAISFALIRNTDQPTALPTP